MSVREIITLQKANLKVEDLYFMLKEIQEEISVREAGLREMIPSI
jgi:hypothetical protein